MTSSKTTLLIIALLAHLGFNRTIAQSMYRGNADHNYNYDSGIKGVFNELSWKFDAEAPIRSTVLAVNNKLHFGSSRGIFYCLDEKTGKLSWVFRAGSAINSSAAYHNGNVFFSDNKQSLYAVNSTTGQLNWKTALGTAKNYDWAFDYYYSSPAIINGQVLIGSKDGFVYNINESKGNINWKFKAQGVVRSSPAVSDNTVYVGDTEGEVFAIDLHSGKQKWVFATEGRSLRNEKFGFDRRAVIAAPVVAGDKVIVGGRDGFLYAINKNTGKQLWRMDHEVSWVIGAVAVKSNIVVTGTSDGHFVQGIDLNSGKQIWKYHTQNVVWSSPVIDGNKVYIGSHEGLLYCIDLKTGLKLASYQTGGIIFGSPVIDNKMLYVGSDDGNLYALKPGTGHCSPVKANRYVFWDETIPTPRNGNDIRIKKYLADNGYKVLNKVKFVDLLGKKDSAANSVIVLATNFFPAEATKDESHSVLRNYLNAGGKIVVLGTNPLVLKLDTHYKAVVLRSFLYADSVIAIKYGPDDLRSYKGNQPAFCTASGKEWGLKKFWALPLSLNAAQVDIVLGRDENGLAAAWVKKFNPAKGSGFVQIWAVENDRDLSFITRVAEYGLK